MHRSGTSLTTGMLNALGVSLSEDLMPATNHNAMGYFESLTIAAIHDQLLGTIGSAWNASETLKPFPARWWSLPQVLPFKNRLKDLVRSEVDRAQETWGFKDPRTARLLPLWDEIFKELDLDPRYVLVVRHPRDVAKSLYSRERTNPVLSELLWLEHYVDAMTHLGSRLNAIVDYPRWFSDPVDQGMQMIRSLGFAPPSQETLAAVVDQFVSEQLRHHDSKGDACILPYSRELYDALVRRDLSQAQMLCELFKISTAFTGKVLEFSTQQVPGIPALAV
jgi:hypothetical protein